MENQETLFTSVALLDFLRQIDELSDLDIDLIDTGDNLTVKIGESSYNIDLKQAEEVEVEEDTVEQVNDIADEALEDLEPEGIEISEETEEVVEGGIIKEALKSLLVGGMVRLTSKLVGKDMLGK